MASGAAAHAAAANELDKKGLDDDEEIDDDEEEEEMMYILPAQKKVNDSYQSPAVQIGVALLICANFIVSALNAQILPEKGSSAAFPFFVLEWVFGMLFLIELIWNIYGSWWKPFINSAWNWFDFIIVMISLMALLMEEMPGISVLRLFRAFRVFRLFKRIESLRIIIEGVIASLPGVMNAFLVLGILMGIWSIMGVEFFRGYSPQEFGSFFQAMLSMWQVMTMDSWASGIARPLIFDHKQYVTAPIFFVSYTFIAGIVMTNVVVAILLEKYLDTTQRIQDEKKAEKAKQEKLAAKANRRPSGIKQDEKNEALKEVEADAMLTVIREAMLDPKVRKFDKHKLAALTLKLCQEMTMDPDDEKLCTEMRELVLKKATGEPYKKFREWLELARQKTKPRSPSPGGSPSYENNYEGNGNTGEIYTTPEKGVEVKK